MCKFLTMFVKKIFIQCKILEDLAETTTIFKIFYILFEMTDSKKENQFFICIEFWKFLTNFLLTKSCKI